MRVNVMMMKQLAALVILFSTMPALAYDRAPVVEMSQNYARPQSNNYGAQSSLDARLNQLERQVQNQAKQNLPSRMEQLQADLQKIRGEMEEQNHELQKLLKQQRAFYEDLDRRIMALQQNTNSSVNPIQSQSSTPSLPVTKTAMMQSDNNQKSVQEVYQDAFNQVRNKNYDQALNDFQSFVDNYPADPLVANAHYWSGEIFSLKGQRQRARSEFELVINQFPNSSKVPDASLKLAILEAGEGKSQVAKQGFEKVIQDYPGTAAARLAEIRLKRLNITTS